MVYVDSLMAHGMVIRGRWVRSCHMFEYRAGLPPELEELEMMARRLHLKPVWRQISCNGLVHYDLTEAMRRRAVELGAAPLTPREAVEIWAAMGIGSAQRTLERVKAMEAERRL